MEKVGWNREADAGYVAAIYFKNRMNKAWDRSNDVATPINEDDRNMVKQSILQALLRAPSAVQ